MLNNMKVTVIPVTVEVLGKFFQNQEKKIGELEVTGRIKIIKTTAVLKAAKIRRGV